MLWMLLMGFLAQLVDGTLGMGYGVSASSMLVAFGLYPAIASASVHTAEVVTTLVSGLSHGAMGNVRRNIVVPLLLPGVIGGVAGALLVSSFPAREIKPVVAIILATMGLLVVFRSLVGKQTFRNLSVMKLIPLGLVAGFLDAAGGGGWGPVMTSSLILSGNGEPHEVVGSVNFTEFVVTLAETSTFMIAIGPEKFRWDIVGLLLVGGVIAAPIAAIICRKLPHRVLGLAIGTLLILLNMKTLGVL